MLDISRIIRKRIHWMFAAQKQDEEKKKRRMLFVWLENKLCDSSSAYRHRWVNGICHRQKIRRMDGAFHSRLWNWFLLDIEIHAQCLSILISKAHLIIQTIVDDQHDFISNFRHIHSQANRTLFASQAFNSILYSPWMMKTQDKEEKKKRKHVCVCEMLV